MDAYHSPTLLLGTAETVDKLANQLNDCAVACSVLDWGLPWQSLLATHRPTVIILIDDDHTDLAQTLSAVETAKSMDSAPICLWITDDTDPVRRDQFLTSGGDDILIAPFSNEELLLKLTRLHPQRDIAEKLAIAQRQAKEASDMALLAMTTSSELGVIIDFLKNASQAATVHVLAAMLIDIVEPYANAAVIGVNHNNQWQFFSGDADLKKAHGAYISKRANTARIIAQDDWLQISQPNIALLLLGVDTQDEERLGRIKDTLAILMEGAQISVLAQLAELRIRQAERARLMFISTMSHELRTPLNSMQGFLQVLLKKPLDSPFRARDQHALQIAERNCQHLLRLVTMILEITYASAEKLDLQIHPLALHELLLQLHDLFAQPAAQRNITIRLTCDENLVISADRERLFGVLYQLTSNAIKFNRDGGDVIISVSRAQHQLLGETIAIKMEDTGIGIKPEHQKELLHHIGQTDESMTRAHGGTGLGLKYAAIIVDLHGGVLSFQSEPNIGSCFTIQLPHSFN